MVMRLRKLFESVSWSPLAKRGNSAKREASDEEVIEAEDVHTTEITNLEDLVNKKTKDLENAREQLRQLSGNVPARGKDKSRVRAAPPQPLELESELLIKTPETTPKGKDTPVPPPPEAELALKTMKASTEDTEGLKLSSASAEEALAASRLPEGVKPQVIVGSTAETSPAAGKPPEGLKTQAAVSQAGEAEPKKTKGEETGDMISSIFNREDEQKNPLASLISSLPDSTMKELFDEVREIKAMLDEWPQN